ncbi:hypothetical protein NVP1161O_023 [Vibrio phage 1.161.O._10N.261.48.C5]|nr:hypothetical protein NVP1161O_023 [Vibrio phage 1.161.O._10N.261.48.C5]
MNNKWEKTLYVADLWSQEWDQENIHELGKTITQRIRKLIPDYENADKYGYQLSEVIEALDNICTKEEAEEINQDNLHYAEINGEEYFEINPVEEFDNWWGSFYDFADSERIWVERNK